MAGRVSDVAVMAGSGASRAAPIAMPTSTAGVAVAASMSATSGAISVLAGTDPVLLMEVDPASAHEFLFNW